jgi:predicted RNase H-like HicB family nuclease
MLIRYIQAAMQHAKFEQMEDARYFATIPQCPGLWADGDTLESCRLELQSVLEDWILIKVRMGDSMPVIDTIDINPQPVEAD